MGTIPDLPVPTVAQGPVVADHSQNGFCHSVCLYWPFCHCCTDRYLMTQLLPAPDLRDLEFLYEAKLSTLEPDMVVNNYDPVILALQSLRKEDCESAWTT